MRRLIPDMHKLSSVLVVSLIALSVFAACGPREPYVPQPREMTARIENDYAESLFSLTVRVGGDDAGVVLFTDERIAANRSATATFQATTGDEVTFDFSAVSLGRVQRFPNITMTPVPERQDTMEITYDFDLATADFVIYRKWSY